MYWPNTQKGWGQCEVGIYLETEARTSSGRDSKRTEYDEEQDVLGNDTEGTTGRKWETPLETVQRSKGKTMQCAISNHEQSQCSSESFHQASVPTITKRR